MSLLSLVIALGVLIVLVLALIAGRLVYKVYRQQKEREEKLKVQEEANQQAQLKQRVMINKSIQILAQALHNEELTLTEASIRISGLLDSLAVSDGIKTEFSAFYQLRDKTNHIPYLEAWKSLSSTEQRRFDKERLQHEATFNDFVMDAAKRILGRNF
jgi:nitric oxide reductase activation protein